MSRIPPDFKELLPLTLSPSKASECFSDPDLDRAGVQAAGALWTFSGGDCAPAARTVPLTHLPSSVRGIRITQAEPDRSRQHERADRSGGARAGRCRIAGGDSRSHRSGVARARPACRNGVGLALAAAGERCRMRRCSSCCRICATSNTCRRSSVRPRADRVALLLDLVEVVTPSWEREVAGAVSRNPLLGAAPASAAAGGLALRSLAQPKARSEATALIGLAAGALDDPGKAIGPYARVGDHATVAAFGSRCAPRCSPHPSTRCRSAKPPESWGVHRGAARPRRSAATTHARAAAAGVQEVLRRQGARRDSDSLVEQFER